MKPLCPRHKRLKREGRLQAAKHWLPKYEGKSIVKGYSKHFGVNKICAVLELRMLEYEIPEDYLEKLKADELLQWKLKEKRKREKELNQRDDMFQYSDETFYFIDGNASNGAQYGLTWNELECESEYLYEQIDSEELPF
ncbi:MAG: hypothetical protein VR72_21385 [Clostridiaceae bacterium BRH_c20a]|nr:MAG: hypothetical protein VR72_21385 [Clostridiaceae bacterium BRH_c20a]